VIIIAQIRTAADSLVKAVPLESFSFTKSIAFGVMPVTGEFIAGLPTTANPTDQLVVKVSRNTVVTEVYRADIISLTGKIIQTAGEMPLPTPKSNPAGKIIYQKSGELARLVFDENINPGDTLLVEPPFTITKITSYGNVDGLLMEVHGG